MSKVGKEILIKIIVRALSQYVMSIFKIPMLICQAIGKITSFFMEKQWVQGRPSLEYMGITKNQERYRRNGFSRFSLLQQSYAWKIGVAFITKPSLIVLLSYKKNLLSWEIFLVDSERITSLLKLTKLITWKKIYRFFCPMVSRKWRTNQHSGGSMAENRHYWRTSKLWWPHRYGQVN